MQLEEAVGMQASSAPVSSLKLQPGRVSGHILDAPRWWEEAAMPTLAVLSARLGDSCL